MCYGFEAAAAFAFATFNICLIAERLSARHPNLATHSHLALYVSHAWECNDVCNCGAGPEGWDFVVRASHV